ncbi:MAG: hypothetical protein AAGG46_08740, partial [Planctomycetota bacterium]
EKLGCRPTDTLRRLWQAPGPGGRFDEPIGFDRLELSLSLDASGCTLGGNAVLTSNAVLASDMLMASEVLMASEMLTASGGEPLLLAPEWGPAPLDALLHLAAPAAERYHPAAPAARKLANRLPLATIK